MYITHTRFYRKPLSEAGDGLSDKYNLFIMRSFLSHYKNLYSL